MEKPKFEEYFLPVLKAFEKKTEISRSEIVDFVIQNYNLIQNDFPKRSFLLINSCIGYYLKAKVLERKEDNFFKITKRGKDLLKQNPKVITIRFLRRYPEFEDFIAKRRSNKKDLQEIYSDVIPEDKILSIYEIHKKNLSLELLEIVKQSSWQFFEILVMDLLIAMGYGDPFDEERIVKGASDNGIDGVIKADVLGLDIICIQAKKWEEKVGRPEIQKFAGSLESHKAKKGIFITTSSFTDEARQYVKSIEKKIVLIDGMRLTELMIDFNIGVDEFRKITLKKIDKDYFETT